MWKLSVDQLRLVCADAEFWWAECITWYLTIAARPWSAEEYECTQGLLVSYLRDFFVESERWHKGVGCVIPAFKVPRA